MEKNSEFTGHQRNKHDCLARCFESHSGLVSEMIALFTGILCATISLCAPAISQSQQFLRVISGYDSY